MASKTALIAIIAVTVSLAGCGYVPQASSHDVYYGGTVERSDGTLHMQGIVNIGSHAEPDRTFRDISLVFYESPDQVIDRAYLGDMSSNASIAPSERHINLTVEPAPKYIYIESPNFWTEKSRPVVAFRWNGSEYEEYYIESADEKFQN